MNIAHVQKINGREQLLRDHLLQTKDISEKLGSKLDIQHITGLAGLLHDFGKYSPMFQEYLRKAVRGDKTAVRGSVDHSTAGGKLLFDLLHENKQPLDIKKLSLAEIVGNAIISHHSCGGLRDFVSPELDSPFLQRVLIKDICGMDEMSNKFYSEVMDQNSFVVYVKKALSELRDCSKNYKSSKDYFFLSKFVYSCLIDADRTNTMLFEMGKTKFSEINTDDLFNKYSQTLDLYMNKLRSSAPENEINRLRMQMSQECADFADNKPGIYTLSIPTGGGKTLASLRYALKHAIKYGKKRIIYVVPFTTIIEQNAAQTRKCLNISDEQTEELLEFHSDVVQENSNQNRIKNAQNGLEESDPLEENELYLTSDNWNSGIVYTTMVQFLNTIFSRGTQAIRRFHNLTNSVIVFDEVQQVPVKCIDMFNSSLNYLKNYGKTTCLLCTATQPTLDRLEVKLEMSENSEIIDNLSGVAKAFKRVDIDVEKLNKKMSILSLSKLLIEIHKSKTSVLVILNTKSAVRNLYKQLVKVEDNKESLFHLSTSMCPEHRKQIISDIKRRLEKQLPVICVSSQLIEAGVDISFECVVKSVSGIDSIAQAAGRCNRNAEKSVEKVFLVNLLKQEENLNDLLEIDYGKDVSLGIIRDLNRDSRKPVLDLLQPEIIQRYFNNFYAITDIATNMKYNIRKIGIGLYQLMGDGRSIRNEYAAKNGKPYPMVYAFSSQTISKYFEVIENPTTGVIVPFGDGKELINELNGEPKIERLFDIFKQLQKYTVNLFDYELKKLDEQGALISLMDGQLLAISDQGYSNGFGVDIDADAPMPNNIL